MLRHLNHHLVLLAALFCIFPAIYGFWWNSNEVPHAVVNRDITPRSYPSLSRRAEPESDSDEDLPTNLGACVPRCLLTKDARNTDGNKVKRSDVLSETSCVRGSSPCSGIRDVPGNWTHRFEKRASGRPLPAFNSNDDLRKKNQQQLNAWIMERLPDPYEKGYPDDVDMIWDGDDPNQYIDLKTYMGRRETKAYAIPTSFFENPGDDAFAWGTIGLVGCSVYVVVKEPTSQDPISAVYFAHIWETPGFSNDFDANRIWTLAQPKAYIKDFISKGFPLDNYDRWAPPELRDPSINTTPQKGLNSYADQFQNSKAFVMHPRKYDLREGTDDTYVEGEGPQHPDGLELLKKTVTQVLKKKVTWQPDYLYLPAREDAENTRAWKTPSGRSIFEYDPHFQMADGSTRKVGMLLFEDGGPRGEPDANGVYKAGPGGPFFFNFGA